MQQELRKKLNLVPGKSAASAVLTRARKSIILAVAAVLLLAVLIFTMTAAWYSNVTETNGLIFETESWGFDGVVIPQDTSIPVAPGQSGNIGVSIANNGDLMNQIAVSVQKSQMDTEIQKRIYVYADTSVVTNEENVEHIYLSSIDSYTYMLMPRGTLTLGDDVCTDVALKYEWVYDLLGYYVRGTVSQNNEGVYQLSSDAEYIRPIVYDYDLATFDDNGNLLTVDGTITKADFLTELSKKDGYANPISIENSHAGYYPVEVDENDTGIWVYLMTKAEIEEGGLYDTAIGQKAAGKLTTIEVYDESGNLHGTEEPPYANVPTAFSITLCVAGQNLRAVTQEAADLEHLQEAIEMGNADCNTICLTNDIAVSNDKTLEIRDGRMLILDLNGQKLRAETGRTTPLIKAEPGSSLTVLNGTIEGNSTGYTVLATGANVAVSDTVINGSVRIDDDNENERGLDSTVRLLNSVIHTPGSGQVGVLLLGNGEDSGGQTQLIVENCTIESSYAGISGNGSNAYWGTNLQVINSKISGEYTSIYQPQQRSYLTVTDSELTGYTGLAIKGGTVNINNSTIHGTGEAKTPTSASMSGWIDTGDALYIETNYDWAIDVMITGDDTKLISDKNCALRVYEPQDKDVTVWITGGMLKGANPWDFSAYLPAGFTRNYEASAYVIRRDSANDLQGGAA